MLDLLNEVTSERTDLLFLALLGESGGGKSHVAGTAPGPVLYVHGAAESHGVTAAKKSGGNILGVCFDRTKEGTLKPDQAYRRILECLNPQAVQKAKIASIIFDGLTELEKLIRETEEFKNRCATKGGGHDTFKEVPAIIAMMEKVFVALREAQSVCGVHVVVLGILDVSEVDKNTGAIETASPRLTGYGVAVTAIQQFGDILAIGKLQKADGSVGRAFQTGALIGKVSKDETKKVKKFINFDCRLQLPPGVELPAFIKADLKEVIKLKGGTV